MVYKVDQIWVSKCLGGWEIGFTKEADSFAVYPPVSNQMSKGLNRSNKKNKDLLSVQRIKN
jgi:hypothetical protein